MKLSASVEGGTFDSLNQTAGVSGSQEAFPLQCQRRPPAQRLDARSPRSTCWPPVSNAITITTNNFTVSSRLGFDLTPDFDLGLVTRYTNTHLHYTGEDYSTFPRSAGRAAERQ